MNESLPLTRLVPGNYETLAAEQWRISAIGRGISSTMNLEEVYPDFARHARALVPSDRLVISVYSDDGSELVEQFVDGVEMENSAPGRRLPVVHNDLYEKVVIQKLHFLANNEENTGYRAESSEEEHRFAEGLNALLIVPLIWQSAVVGVISFRSFDDDAFGVREIDLAWQIANQIAGAIASANQYAIVERQSRERELLTEIGRIVSSTLDIDEIFAVFAEQARQLVPFDRIVVSEFSEDKSEIIPQFVSGMAVEGSGVGTRLPTSKDEVFDRLVNQKLPFVIHGTAYRKYAELVPVERPRFAAGFRSLLSVPLVWQGNATGAITFRAFEPDAFGVHQIELARQVTNQIAGAIATSNQYVKLESESRERERLVEIQRRIAEIGRIVSSTLDLDDVFSAFVEQAKELVPFDRLVISLNALDGKTTVDAFVGGEEIENGSAGRSYTISDGPRESVIRDDAVLVANEDAFVKIAKRWKSESMRLKAGLRSLLIVPLTWQGSVVGTLIFRSRQSNPYGGREVDLARQIGAQIAGAISTSNQYRRLREVVEELRIDAAAIEAASDAIVILSPDTTVEYVNEAFEHQTGLLKGQVTGTKLFANSPQNHAKLILQMSETILSRNVWRGTVTDERIDGTEYTVDASLNPIFGEDGNVTRFISISRDITDKIQVEKERAARRELDAENQRLQRTSQERDEFFSLVSHELRTPLAAVLAFADIMSRNRDGNLTSKQLEQVDVIKRNSHNLNDLIGDMVDISRLNTERLRLEKSEFEVHALAISIIESLEPTARERNQVLRIVAHVGPIWITADKGRITQVISNLITNSCKYSPPSTPISVKIGQEDDRVAIVVEDEGFGIAPEDLREIFTPFFRSGRKEIRAEIGTGLGLAISKTLVELHGGEIEATSELGEGTKMRVTLPGANSTPTGTGTGTDRPD